MISAMLCEYFGLRDEPFRVTPDPRFFFAGPIHEHAAQQLLSAVREADGPILLTGPPGSGKTLLLRWLLTQLASQTPAALVWAAHMGFDDFLSSVCNGFGLPERDTGCAEKLQAIASHLRCPAPDTQRPVLLLDEADKFSEDTLEQLPLLTDLDQGGVVQLAVVMAAGEGFRARLSGFPLGLRVARECRLFPLGRDEVYGYVRYRLQVAGHTGQDLFSGEAIDRLAVLSRGIPRQINAICGRALMLAFLNGDRSVSAAVMEEIGQDVWHALPEAMPLPAYFETSGSMPTVQAPGEQSAAPAAQARADEVPMGARTPEAPPAEPAPRETPPAERTAREAPPAAAAAAGTAVNAAAGRGAAEPVAVSSAVRPQLRQRDAGRQATAVPGAGEVEVRRRNPLALAAGIALLAGIVVLWASRVEGPLPEAIDEAGRPPVASAPARASDQAGPDRRQALPTAPKTPPPAPAVAGTGGGRQPASASAAKGTAAVSRPATSSDAADVPIEPAQPNVPETPPATAPARTKAPVISDAADEVAPPPEAKPADRQAAGKADDQPADAGEVRPGLAAGEPDANAGKPEVAMPATEPTPRKPERTEAKPGAGPGEAKPVGISSSKVARARLTSGISRREPIDALGAVVAARSRGVKPVYFFTELRGMRGTTVTHRWEYEGKVVAEVQFKINGNRWRVYSRRDLTPALTGHWRALALDSGGNILASTQFTYQ